MSTKMEDKLANLIHEIKEIRMELVLQKIKKAEATEQKIEKWKALGKKISNKWNNTSSVEEVRQQREKSQR